MNVKELLAGHRVIPVVTISDIAHALPLAEALLVGGIGVIEVTLRTPVGLAAIKLLRDKLPDMKTGAGTVLSPLQFTQAHEVGAQFFVSPGLSHELAESGRGLRYLPGVATPSEAMKALEYGFTTLKLFPAMTVGGIDMLKHLGSVLPQISFCPTGGVTEKTMPDFLALKNVFAVGGSWLTPASAIESGNWKEITAIAKRSLAAL